MWVSHPWDVLGRYGSLAAFNAGMDTGDCNVFEYSGVDDVGRVVLLRSFSVDGAIEEAGERGPAPCEDGTDMGRGNGTRSFVHHLQSRRAGVRGSLQLRKIAAGTEVHADSSPG